MWVANAIAPAGMHILCIVMRYNKPNKLEVSYLLHLFNKTSASVLYLEFQYFELQNIYKRIPSPIRIPIFSSELASSFIDSGVGLVLSIWFILAVVLNSKNKFIVAKLTVSVWCGVAIMNRQIIYTFTDTC